MPKDHQDSLYNWSFNLKPLCMDVRVLCQNIKESVDSKGERSSDKVKLID